MVANYKVIQFEFLTTNGKVANHERQVAPFTKNTKMTKINLNQCTNQIGKPVNNILIVVYGTTLLGHLLIQCTLALTQHK